MLIDWGLIGCFCLDGTGYDLKLFFFNYFRNEI